MVDLSAFPGKRRTLRDAAGARSWSGSEASDIRDALRALRDPALSADAIEAIAASARLVASREVRCALALHLRTPLPTGLLLVPTLGWRDLARLADNVRLNPRLRTRAEQVLVERAGELSTGERAALARIAGKPVIKALRGCADAAVVSCLLDNPRLLEEDVSLIVKNRDSPSRVLSAVAASARWNGIRGIKMALALNPASPASASLHALHGLDEKDLRAIAESLFAPRLVRMAAGRLLAADRPVR